MPESVHRFREDLKRLEACVVGGIDLVIAQLDRAQESLNYQDVELARMVVADDARLDERFVEVHQGALDLLARQAPGPEEARTIAALLHIARCMERMGDQCVNIATLVPLSGYEAPKDKEMLDTVEKMELLARSQVVQARDALRLHDASTGRNLAAQDAVINRLNRAIFQRAVEIGEDFDVREWAMFMILVARCVERIGDNTVDIGEQVAFVVTGRFREMDSSPAVAGERPV